MLFKTIFYIFIWSCSCLFACILYFQNFIFINYLFNCTLLFLIITFLCEMVYFSNYFSHVCLWKCRNSFLSLEICIYNVYMVERSLLPFKKKSWIKLVLFHFTNNLTILNNLPEPIFFIAKQNLWIPMMYLKSKLIHFS